MIEEKQNDKKFSFNRVLSFLKYLWQELVKFPLYMLGNPFKGYDEFKRGKRGKLWVAVLFLFLLAFINILEYQFIGHIIDPTKDIQNLKPFYEIILIYAIVIVITISNWAFTTLFNGKGKMKEIFTMLGYATFPFIVAKFFGLILSNFITLNDAQIYTLLIAMGMVLMIYLAFIGFLNIHEYGVLKTFGSLIATAVAILIIAFVFLLSFDLFQKMYGFAYSIYQEIALRYM